MTLQRIVGSGALILAGAVVAAGAVASPASASQSKTWTYGPAKSLKAAALYQDGNNTFCVSDVAKDGHSVLASWHFAGAATHHLWDTKGVKNGVGSTTCHTFKRSNENKTIVFKLCTGEYAKKAANRRVIACGAQHSFWI